jgi:hypothetical protein
LTTSLDNRVLVGDIPKKKKEKEKEKDMQRLLTVRTAGIRLQIQARNKELTHFYHEAIPSLGPRCLGAAHQTLSGWTHAWAVGHG